MNIFNQVKYFLILCKHSWSVPIFIELLVDVSVYDCEDSDDSVDEDRDSDNSVDDGQHSNNSVDEVVILIIP